MSRLRTTLLWLCCAAVLVAGTPCRAFVWCQRTDGTVALEATGPGGRCAHPGDETLASDSGSKGPGLQAASFCEGCVDRAFYGESLLPRADKFPPISLVVIALGRIFPMGDMPGANILQQKSTPILHVDRAASDASRVRETIVLVI